MRRYRYVVAGLLLAGLASFAAADALPTATPDQSGVSAQRIAAIRPLMEQYVADGRLAGSVTLVARNGRVVTLEAVGMRDRESGSPMRADSIFRIASQTKAIVSVAVLMLQEEGKLLISEPLHKYFPEFRDSKVAVPRAEGGYELVKANRPITLRDLLTHTSGISYGTGPGAAEWQKAGIQNWYFADRDEPIATTVAKMGALPLDAQPGERWVYGFNTDILGAVVERASGQPLDQFLRTRILEPLRMVDTQFYLPRDKSDRLVVVYSAKPGGGLERAPVTGGMVSQGAYVEGPRKAFSGGAGLTSTATDYARFLQMMLNGGELDGARILSRKSVELMTSNHVGDRFQPGSGFGLGVSVLRDLGARGDLGSVGEFGWGGAYHSSYWVDPQEQLVVVQLTQTIPAGDVDDFGRLRALVYGAISDPEPGGPQ
jgi:CubicO group peptidase (beta-lactamase class C family)